jgi:ATPase subunit of ABC transporter with duplicated ATPase domains
MLQANRVTKYYGAQLILDSVSFTINPSGRVGLVGPNGSGKTTLLRILAGEEEPDNGTVSLSSGSSLGYLPQGVRIDQDTSISDYVLSGIEGHQQAKNEMSELAARLEADPQNKQLLAMYGDSLTQFERLGGYALEHRMQAILDGLGVGYLLLETPVRQLSGGEGTRVSLARLLLSVPSYLLLDEPTNHLDIEALEWLEDFLHSYSGAVLVVSHDRALLDNTVKRILELGEHTHKVREYTGNYSDYALEKAREYEKLLAIWKDQQAEIRRLEADIQRTKQQAQNTEQKTIDSSQRRYAKKVAKKATVRQKRLHRYLESDNRIEKPATLEHIRLDFGKSMRSGQMVARLENIGLRYGERWLFQIVNLDLQYGDRVALVGPNGSGKTSLLRLIMDEIPPAEGIIRTGPSVQFGYMPQKQENLDPTSNAMQVIQALAPIGESEVHHFLHFFLFQPDEVRREVGRLSYGQRARLLLARLVVSGANCLVLDEPINHLDIPSREQFEEALMVYQGTVLVAAHDRAFVRRFAQHIWRIHDQHIQKQFEL